MEPKLTSKLISLLFSIASLLSLPCSTIASSSNFSAVFGFGDSTMDTGNNNYRLTTFRSDFKPYGRDFPDQKPTGRFSNGKLPIDFIVSGLGLKEFLPPYLNSQLANDQELLTGVNFGSAGTGLDPLTAVQANVLSFPDQLDLFGQALQRIKRLVGEEKANYIVEKALFVIYFGTNDFTNFYNNGVRSVQFNISAYQDFVLKKLEDDIQRLYNMGGRKIVVKSLEPIGCLPIQITLAGNINNRTCIQNQNNDSILYNQKLQSLISRLVLPNATIIYFDVYNPFLDVINNPAKYGFEVALKGCCGTGLYEYGPTCREPIRTCPDPTKYIFWDAVHATQSIYSIEGTIFIQTIAPQFNF